MNFVIGGVPRSGTTILSKILNAHEQVYSYSSETNIFRHMWLYGRYGPLSAAREAEFRSYLTRDMNIAFREHFEPYIESLQRYQALLTRFNPKIPERPLLPLFSEQDISDLHEEIVALMMSGKWGAPLFRAASALMGKWLRLRSGRHIVGEKTPDNIISMPLITQATPESLFVATFRDPIPTIRSMMNRSKGSSSQDGVFSAEFLASLGHYETYARAILAAKQNTKRIHLVQYEDLMDRPGAVIHEIMVKLGLAADMDVRKAALALIGQAPERPDAHSGFSPGEIRIAKLVLGPFAKDLGFQSDLEVTKGRPYATHNALPENLPTGLIPIASDYQASGLARLLPNPSNALRFSEKATALLCRQQPARKIVLSLTCRDGDTPAQGYKLKVYLNHQDALNATFSTIKETVEIELTTIQHASELIEGTTYANVLHFAIELPKDVAFVPPVIEVRVHSVN